MTSLLSGPGPGRQILDDDVDLVRDRALVERAQAGDHSAFDDLYQRYYRRLLRFCLRRLHDQHEAEDVAQEAFARAWRALPSFAGDRRFYPWLSVIASHLCTDVLRRRNRSTPVAEFHQSNMASLEDSGEELAISAVDSAQVASAFRRLSERHQRILALREGSGWSYQRIADHEGVGVTAVETLLWRARQALKREFAAVAGTEGRLAGGLVGLFSLDALRRWLRTPVHLARKLVPAGASWSPVATAATAAVATAAVVAATGIGGLASSPTPTSVPGAIVGGAGVASKPASARSSTEASGPSMSATGGGVSANSGTGGHRSAPSGGSGTSSSSAVTGGGSGVGALGGAVNGLGGAVGGLGNTVGGLGGLGNTVGGALGSGGSTVGGLSSTLGADASPLAFPLGAGLSQALSGTGQSVSSAVSGVTSTLGSATGSLPSGGSSSAGSAGTGTGTGSKGGGTASGGTGSTTGSSGSCPEGGGTGSPASPSGSGLLGGVLGSLSDVGGSSAGGSCPG